MNKTPPSFTLYNDSAAIHIAEKQAVGNFDQVFSVGGKEEVFSVLDGFFGAADNTNIALYGYDAKTLFKDVKRYFKFIEAAGGLVVNEHNKYLFIKRFGIWDLPKGKMEKGEKPLQSALREVIEETAVEELVVEKKLQSTYHIYPGKEKMYLKKTYWYLMRTNSKKLLVPQTNESITKAVWLNKSESIEAIKQSYRSLKETFLDVIKG